MDDWAELDHAISAMVATGGAEVREDGEWLAEFAGLQCELRRAGKDALVHLWSEQRNLTRRVLRIHEKSEQRIVLEVQRFGRARPGRLEFLRTDSPRSPGRIAREQFRARFRRILAERFPDGEAESLTAAPDLEHSFSGLYVRGCMREGARAWALLAVASGENAAAIEGILAFGILWLDWTRNHSGRRAIDGLRLFIPEGGGRLLRERIRALSPSARTEIFEFRERDGWVQRIDSADAGNIESGLIPRQESEGVLQLAREAAARVAALAPVASSANGKIRVRMLPGGRQAALCFRGLEFARWSREGIEFGLGDSRQTLTAATEPALERLTHELDLHRSAHASDAKHPVYRAAPERWLESLVIEDPTRLDAQLEPRYLYPQVPAVAAGDRSVIDLLGATRRGRLVVIELKASEDLQLPMQALDYWLRVRRHQREGDLARCGYFAGLELDSAPPLVWLVAPALHFHPATDTLLKCLSPEIEVTRIGVNENWRSGLKVVLRQ